MSDKDPNAEKRVGDMDVSLYSSWRTTKTEFARLIFQAALIVLLFYPDWGALRTLAYVFGVFMGVTLIAHVSRKYALFPYVNMRELYNRARKDPIGAAIVFASMAGIVMVCIDTAGKFFARG